MRHRPILVAITGLAGVDGIAHDRECLGPAAEATAAAVSTAAVDSTPLPEASAELLRSTGPHRSARPVHRFNQGLQPLSNRGPGFAPRQITPGQSVGNAGRLPGARRPRAGSGAKLSTIPSALEIGIRPSDSLMESIAGTSASTRTPSSGLGRTNFGRPAAGWKLSSQPPRLDARLLEWQPPRQRSLEP